MVGRPELRQEGIGTLVIECPSSRCEARPGALRAWTPFQHPRSVRGCTRLRQQIDHYSMSEAIGAALVVWYKLAGFVALRRNCF